MKRHDAMANLQDFALKVAALLWVICGLVHAFSGVIIVSGTATAGFQALGDAVDPAAVVNDYHPVVGAVLNQHGWILLWVGIATVIGAFFVWRANTTAIWVVAMIAGLFDVGYFVFLDLGGFVNFFPGTLMTIVSATAVILSAPAWFAQRRVTTQ
ncbi:MAG: hypothetical protein AAFQ99_13960 [Pseudomonadota bacterium]